MIVFTVKVSFRYVGRFKRLYWRLWVRVRLIADRPSGGLLGIEYGLSRGLGRVALTVGKLQLQEHPLRC